MLFKISREARELPWQPNLDKNKPKLHGFQFSARNRGIFRINSKVFGVTVFKYALVDPVDLLGSTPRFGPSRVKGPAVVQNSSCLIWLLLP